LKGESAEYVLSSDWKKSPQVAQRTPSGLPFHKFFAG